MNCILFGWCYGQENSRYLLWNEVKTCKGWTEVGTCNPTQYIAERDALQSVRIVVWSGISLGYRTDLHNFKRGTMTAVRYQDEVLDTSIGLLVAAVGFDFVLMADMCIHIDLSSPKSTCRMRALCIWNGWRFRPNLIPMKMFEIPSIVLCEIIFFFQQLSHSTKFSIGEMAIAWLYVCW